MKKNNLVLYFLFSLFFIGCAPDKPSEFKLTIIETSDIHGAIFNYDFIMDSKLSASLSQVQSYVKSEKINNEVILIDNGDILQGQPIVYYYNYQNTIDSHIVTQVMNYMQYNAATIGNHDIEAGHNVYDKLVNEFNFPVLAANAIRTDNGEPYFNPYTIINREGFKIAVFGLITPRVPDWLPEVLWEGIEFEDMIISAQKWVPIIQRKEKPDLLVGLFHSGFDYTYANSDEKTLKNENASLLVAKQVPGFDIVFIGHDHETRNEKIINSEGKEVLILGPQNDAKQVAEAKIYFKKKGRNKYEKTIESGIVEIKDYPVDSLFVLKFNKQSNEAKEFITKPIGEFKNSLCSFESNFGPSPFLELIHAIHFNIANADISLAANQSFDACIDKGPVYIRDMFKLFKYENFLYTMNLTGAEIKNYLEYSYANWFNEVKSSSDHLLIFKANEKGEPLVDEINDKYVLQNRFYNFDVAGGLVYLVDISKPKNQKINIISLTNGRFFHLDSTYKVAINSYRGNGGGGLLEVGAGIDKNERIKRRIFSTDKDIRFYAIKWIEENKIINTDFKTNWKVIPEELWIKTAERDKKLLQNK